MSAGNKMPHSKGTIFSPLEKEVLLKLVEEDMSIIESKCNKANVVYLKEEAWSKLAVKFNHRLGFPPRSKAQLRCLWKNLKSRAAAKRTLLSQPEQERERVYFDPMSERICNMLCMPVPAMCHPYDSDSDSVKAERINNAERSLASIRKRHWERMEDPHTNSDETNSSVSDDIVKVKTEIPDPEYTEESHAAGPPNLKLSPTFESTAPKHDSPENVEEDKAKSNSETNNVKKVGKNENNPNTAVNSSNSSVNDALKLYLNKRDTLPSTACAVTPTTPAPIFVWQVPQTLLSKPFTSKSPEIFSESIHTDLPDNALPTTSTDFSPQVSSSNSALLNSLKRSGTSLQNGTPNKSLKTSLSSDCHQPDSAKTIKVEGKFPDQKEMPSCTHCSNRICEIAEIEHKRKMEIFKLKEEVLQLKKRKLLNQMNEK